MQERPLFESPAQAAMVTFNMTRRLAIVVSWCWVWLAHLTLGLLAVAGLWWWEVSPAGAALALRAWSESKPVSVLSAVGVSVLGALGAYWWAVCRLRSLAVTGWLVEYLIQDSKG